MKQYKITIYRWGKVVCNADAHIDTDMGRYCNALRVVFGRDSIIEFEIKEKS